MNDEDNSEWLVLAVGFWLGLTAGAFFFWALPQWF